jgi:hypothetical protein
MAVGGSLCNGQGGSEGEADFGWFIKYSSQKMNHNLTETQLRVQGGPIVGQRVGQRLWKALYVEDGATMERGLINAIRGASHLKYHLT